MAKITWANRTDIKAAIGATYEWVAAIANEVKTSVNALYTDINIWYVSKDGSNSNIGSTKAEPFLTQEAAHTAAATDDIIETLDVNVTYTESFTVTKRVIFRGPVSNQVTLGGYRTTLAGTWAMNIDNVVFENFNISQTFTISVLGRRLLFSSCYCYPTLTARNTQINLINSLFEVTGTTDMNSLKAINSRLLNGTTLNIGEDLELYAGSSIDAAVVCGLDAAADVVLRNSNITGALTITGNLDQENSTVKGALSVSGTTTVEVQDDTTKLSLTAAADQAVVGNVEFKKGIKVGETPGALAEGITFGDGNTGFYESIDNTLKLQGAGTDRFQLLASQGAWAGQLGGSSAMINENASFTNPTLIPDRGDFDTGIGGNGSDALSLIAGAVEGVRVTENTGIITSLFTDSYGSKEMSADPADPAEGQHAIWQSDGTGSGDDGDIMMKITAGGVTKTTTLVDFSTI